MNSDPSRVMAQRGMLSKKPTSSMMVTISAGRVVSVSADSPEAVMMVEIMPCATLKSAVISSMTWVTAAWASTKRIKHLNTIEDLKGMKLRVSNDPIMNGLVEGLGASPTVVSFGELYSGLSTKVCDGAEQPIGNYKSNAFDEVAPNLILDGHTLGAVQVIITDNAWGKLTEAQQAVIMEAAAYAQKFNQEYVEGAEQEVLDGLKADGVNVIEVADKTPWAEACKPVIEQYTAGDLADLYQKIQDLK